jgi:ABC-2 type transport system ATP-binding protein
MDTLEVVGLTRRYGERVAVDGLSFSVTLGEVVGLLGPNGAGKTTTFAMLAGLLPADGGHLLVDGERLAPGARSLRARMGVVFQNPSIDPKLTARENLAMGATLYGVPRREARERIAWALDLVGLTDRASDHVETFSGGMRRRLELARVLLHRPAILLLDEPTQGLDISAARRIWAELLEIRRKEQLTILLTTHSPEEAEHCDRILVLDKGKTIARGTPDELREKVGGDVVVIGSDDPTNVVVQLKEKLQIDARLVEGLVVFAQIRAHELVPRVVEALPHGSIKSVAMHRASIGDVFLELTGQTIDGADAEEAEILERRKHKAAAKKEARR